MLSLSDARCIALAAQGFDRPRPSGRVTRAQILRVVRQLGLLQIDYVNVLVPAQYQVLFSRLGPYPLALLDTLTFGSSQTARGDRQSPPRTRALTEQWAREASIVPVDRWPMLRYRMDTYDRRWRSFTAFLGRHPDYAAQVLENVRRRGAVTAADIPEPDGSRGRKAGGFWSWTLAKRTLESLFASGALAIADRRMPSAARVYDLVERVIPAAQSGHTMTRDEAVRGLLLAAARAHGIGTAEDLADYYRLPIREARRHAAALASEGELREVQVEGWRELAYLHAKAARPRALRACTLLSPFDPVVWHRGRTARLFGFDYLLEIWVPAAKRRWGYYVLPFLFGDRLVARVDLKADRAAGRLLVLAAYVEPHADRDRVAPALATELRTMAAWLGLTDVRAASRGNFARPLSAALRA